MKMLSMVILVVFTCGLFAISPLSSTDNIDQASVIRNISSMPLAFTQNNGQWPDSILFRANASGATMWFTPTGAYYQFTRQLASDTFTIGRDPRHPGMELLDQDPGGFDNKSDSIEILMLKATLVGANSSPEIVGRDLMEHKSNYFFGNDQTKWRTDVPNYSAIVMKEVYPGIDLTYYGNGRRMEYDFVVGPGADYSQIRVQYDGAKSVSVNVKGELVVETEWGTVTELTPTIYQIENGEKKAIRGEYCLLSEDSFGFHLDDSYNSGLAVTIDPVLSYSTYLGGDNRDHAWDIEVDSTGASFIIGSTYSSNFPTANPYDASVSNCDVFVTKFSSDGASLVYSTYLGGSSNDTGYAVVLRNGRAYLTGYTTSSNFPTVNAYDAIANGGWDVFISILSSGGNNLDYSTYLGGSGAEAGHDIALGGENEIVYITGWTLSSNFPKASAYDATLSGYDAFIAKLSTTTNTLYYSTYVGGSGNDIAMGIAVDATRNAYITGYTSSTDFPTVNPYDASYNGAFDIFVTKFSISGTTLDYSTYLGGALNDAPNEIALDASGAAYIAGNTGSTDFPTLNAYQETYQGGDYDVIAAKFSTLGSLQYSTYLGGNSRDIPWGIAINKYGKAYITGYTSSSNFPMAYPYDASMGVWNDIFVTRLSGTGNNILFSTYLGGNSDEHGGAIAVDTAENVYITGFTQSSDFPTANAYDASYNGDYDVFLTKLNMHVTSVTNLNDNGWGSLREAINYAYVNPGIDTILFAVSGTISLATALPAILSNRIIILGSSAPGGSHSVILDGSALLSGDGLLLQCYDSKIEGLTIRNFPGNGIKITGASNAKNTITKNLIYKNGGLAIDLGGDGVTANDVGDGDTGPNDLLNFPVIDSVFMNLDSSFSVWGHAADKAHIEFFVAHPANESSKPADPSGHGEAHTYIGADTATGGAFAFLIPKTNRQFSIISVTATDTLRNTSEFCQNFTLTPSPLIIVAYSPVNLKITNPNGYYIGKDSLGNLGQTLFPATYNETPNDSINIPNPILGQYQITVVRQQGAPAGSLYSIGVRIDGTEQCMVIINAIVPNYGATASFTYEVGEGWHYKNGDANDNGNINIQDITFLINYLYKGGPPPMPVPAGDANCSGNVNIQDITYLINFLYKGGPMPCQIS